MAAPSTRARRDRLSDAGWLAPTVLAAVVGLFLISRRPGLWFDEAYTVEQSRGSVGDLVRLIRHTPAVFASAYYLTVHAWGTGARFGYGELSLRMLSLVCALGAIPVMHAIGRRLFDRRVATIAALLIATNAFFIEFAIEIRMYAPVLLLILVATYAFLEIIDHQQWKWWGWYVAAGAVAVLCQWFGAFVLCSHVAAAGVLWWRRRLPRRALFLTCTGAIAALGPAVVLIGIARASGNHFEDGISWIPSTSLKSAVDVFDRLSGNLGPLFLLLLTAAGLASVRFRLRDPVPGGSDATVARTITASWLVVPIVLALVLSIVQPVFIDRYLIVVLPPALLLVAAGIASFGRLAPALAAVLILWSLLGVAKFEHHQTKQDWRTAMATLEANARPDDGILVYSPTGQTSFRYYAVQDKPALLRQLIPVPYVEPIDKVELIGRAQRFPRVWVVHNELGLYTANEDAAIVNRLSSVGYHSVQRTDFPGRYGPIGVELFTRS